MVCPGQADNAENSEAARDMFEEHELTDMEAEMTSYIYTQGRTEGWWMEDITNNRIERSLVSILIKGGISPPQTGI